MLAAPNPPLSDGIISLRPPEERDLSAIERGINDPDVIRWFGRPTESAEELLELNQRRWNDDESATFAICEVADPCVGHVWVNLVDARRGFVGYWLLAEARGRGLAIPRGEARLTVGAS